MVMHLSFLVMVLMPKISHIGTSHIFPNISLCNVLVVPNLKKILLFVGKLTEDNEVDIVFSNPLFTI